MLVGLILLLLIFAVIACDHFQNEVYNHVSRSDCVLAGIFCMVCAVASGYQLLYLCRDTSGQGRFCTIFRSYSRGAQVSVCQSSSFCVSGKLALLYCS